MDEYNQEIKDLLVGYDSGKISNRSFVYSIAWAKLHFGGEDGAKQCESIRTKADGITKDFANGLIVRLMKSDFVHVNGCIVNFTQSYLHGEYSAERYIESCTDCWQQSDRVGDDNYAEQIWREYQKKFWHFAETLRTTEVKRLMEV